MRRYVINKANRGSLFKHFKLSKFKLIDYPRYKRVNKQYILKYKKVGAVSKFVPVFKEQKQAYNYLIYRLSLKKTEFARVDKNFKFENTDIIPNICESFEIVQQTTITGTNEYLIYNYSENIFVPIRTLLYAFITTLDNSKVIKIPNFETAFRQAVKQLENLESFNNIHYNLFNRAPIYWLNVKNGVFDLKTKKFIDTHIAKQYHFTSKINFNVVEPTKVNKLFALAIERMFNNWTDDDEEKKTLLQQIAFAMIDGNGRKKSVIFQSPGGGGKSTFIKINSLIVGNNNVINCGMYELNDDNKVGQLSPSIKFMQGDDANTNARMNDIALSRMKSLNDGGEFMVNVKFEPSKNVYFHGLIIQNTNSDIGFYENNPALADRILLFEWTSKNFRAGDSKLEIELSDMLGNVSMGIAPNQEFLEAYLSYILYSTEWFINYTIPDSVKESTKSLLATNDNVAAYVEFLREQGVLELPYINASLEHKRYELWLADYNSGAKPLKSIKFTKEFTEKLEAFGYTKLNSGKPDNRIKPQSLSLLDYNNDVFNKLTTYEIDLANRLRYTFLVNEDYIISDDDFKNFDYMLKSDQIDLTDAKTLAILHHKCFVEEDTMVISRYLEYLQD